MMWAWILLLSLWTAALTAQTPGQPPLEACKPGDFTVVGFPDEFGPKAGGKFEVIVDEKFRGKFLTPLRNWIPFIQEMVPKWNGISGSAFEFQLRDVSPLDADPFDGRTTIASCGGLFVCFEEPPFTNPVPPPFSPPFPPGTVQPQAILAVTLLVSSNDPVRAITDADVYFNPEIPFSLDPAENQIDFESVLLHELGHVAGLGHNDNCVTGPTVMESVIDLAEVRRELAGAERDGIRFLYPDDSSPAAHLFDSESSLSFHAIEGALPPFEQSFRIFGRRAGIWTATASTDSGGGWLQLPAARGTFDADDRVVVEVDSQSLPAGTYTGRVSVNVEGHAGPPATVDVTLVVSETQPVWAPILLSAGIVNGANFGSREFAPGAILSIFGQWLSGASRAAAGFPLPTNLEGTEVLIGGVKAPLLWVSPTQINAIIPQNLPTGPSGVIVRSGLGQSPSFGIDLKTAAPEVFLLEGGNAAALNQDGTLNSIDNPAALGSIVSIFLTGQGPTDPSVPPDRPAPREPLARITSEARATLGGQPAQIPFLGLAPDFAGVAQANIVVPSGLSGRLVLEITIAGQASPVRSTIWVR